MLSPERIQKLDSLQQQMKYQFRDPALLNKALTHKSYANENQQPIKDNERFEFLGDSVLDLIVSGYMLKAFPDYSEGTLSKIRAAVVNEACLADLAREINLGDYLLLGKGEEASGGRQKNSLLANAYEALAGAVYFDSDFGTALEIYLPVLEKEIAIYSDTARFRDYKSELQEYTQTHFNCIPGYRIVKESGPDHAKEFELVVMVRDEVCGQGKGKSKKEGEQAAAKIALAKFKGLSGN